MLIKQRATLAWLLMLPVLLTGCFKSETVVTKVDTGKPLDKLDGVHYSLPRTVVKVSFPVKRTEEKPGPLERFTPCFFPADIANMRTREKSVSYSIEDPTFAYRVEPDPDQHFIVSVKGGFFEKKSLLLDYVPGGIISKGTAESTNEALEFTLKAIKTGTSIVTGIMGIPKFESGRIDSRSEAERKNDKAREDRLSKDEKEALNCLQRKYLVMVQEEAEAEKARKEAEAAASKAVTADEKKAANEALKKAQDNETRAEKAVVAAKEESEALEKYLRQEADERIAIQEAEERAKRGDIMPNLSQQNNDSRRKRRNKNENSSNGNGSNRNSSTGNGSMQDGNVNSENEGTGAVGNSQGTDGSGNGLGEANRNSGAQAIVLPQRTPVSADDLKAEKLMDEYQRAKMTFEDIKDLEKKRLELISGRTGSDGIAPDTLKEMLSQLDKALDGRKNLFFGSKAEKPWTATFDYRPEAKLGAIQTSKPLLWFAEKGDNAGLCKTPESREQGVIIPDKFVGKKCGSDPAVAPAGMDVIYLHLTKNTDDQLFRDRLADVQKKFNDEKKKRGWYYRVPAKATVVLKVGKLEGTTYASADGNRLPPPVSGDSPVAPNLPGAQEVRRDTLSIAQLGVTISAPASGAGRTNQSTVEYDDFGALKNFKYASDPLLQQSYLDEAQGTAQTIIDAKTKSNEAKKAKAEAAATAAASAAAAAAAANDPLTKMKTELETLQTQNKINEERKKLEEQGGEEEEETP